MTKEDKLFMRGYIAACSNYYHMHRDDVATRETLIAGGITTIAKMRSVGVVQHDIDILKPVIKEISRRKNLIP